MFLGVRDLLTALENRVHCFWLKGAIYRIADPFRSLQGKKLADLASEKKKGNTPTIQTPINRQLVPTFGERVLWIWVIPHKPDTNIRTLSSTEYERCSLKGFDQHRGLPKSHPVNHSSCSFFLISVDSTTDLSNLRKSQGRLWPKTA